MNRPQRIIVGAGVCSLLAMCVYPPLVHTKAAGYYSTSWAYDWLWSPGTIDTSRLSVQCFVVSALTGLLAYGLRPAGIRAIAKRKKLVIVSLAVAGLAAGVTAVMLSPLGAELYRWWRQLPSEQTRKIVCRVSRGDPVYAASLSSAAARAAAAEAAKAANDAYTAYTSKAAAARAADAELAKAAAAKAAAYASSPAGKAAAKAAAAKADAAKADAAYETYISKAAARAAAAKAAEAAEAYYHPLYPSGAAKVAAAKAAAAEAADAATTAYDTYEAAAAKAAAAKADAAAYISSATSSSAPAEAPRLRTDEEVGLSAGVGEGKPEWEAVNAAYAAYISKAAAAKDAAAEAAKASASYAEIAGRLAKTHPLKLIVHNGSETDISQVELHIYRSSSGIWEMQSRVWCALKSGSEVEVELYPRPECGPDVRVEVVKAWR